MKKHMRLTSLAVLAVGAPMMMGLLQVSSCGLTRQSFTKIAGGGVDNRLNSYPWGTELFDGDNDGEPEFYVGTVANALCIQASSETYLYSIFGPDWKPPLRWQCRNDLWDPNNQTNFNRATAAPAYVFRGDHQPDDTWTWTRIWDPNFTTQVNGFRGAIAFNGSLYMLGSNTTGAQVWKMNSNETFSPASPKGMGLGALVTGLRGATVFNGKLYVASDKIGTIWGSANPSTDPNSWQTANSNGFVQEGGNTHEQIYYTGTVTAADANSVTDSNLPAAIATGLLSGWGKIRITEGVAAGQIRTIVYNAAKTFYVWRNGSGTKWSPVPAVGDKYQVYNPTAADNSANWQLSSANGYLYAATLNVITGAEVWKSNDPRPGNWTRIVQGAYGNSVTQGYMTVYGWNGYIWLGTVVYPPNFDGFEDIQGCEILRIDANDNVEVLVGIDRPAGTPGTNNGKPLSGMGEGFDYKPNVYSWFTGAHDGWYYVGTYDMAGMLLDILDEYYPDGVPPDMQTILDQTFWGSDAARRGGFDLWRTKDGINWYPVVLDGFGDRDNYGVRAFKSSPWGAIVGLANAVDGFEIWIGK
jgi:hypothetical protein